MGRYLGPADVEAALKGGAVFACGGGGFLEHGRTLGTAAVNAGRPELVSMDEIPDDAWIATAAAIGAPGGFTAWEMRGVDYVKAVQLVERELSQPIHGLMIGQNGKSSTVNAWLPSAILGCKVVDAVGDVRAHPTGDMGSIGLAKSPEPTIQSAVGGNRAENRYIELVAEGPDGPDLADPAHGRRHGGRLHRLLPQSRPSLLRPPARGAGRHLDGAGARRGDTGRGACRPVRARRHRRAPGRRDRWARRGHGQHGRLQGCGSLRHRHGDARPGRSPSRAPCRERTHGRGDRRRRAHGHLPGRDHHAQSRRRAPVLQRTRRRARGGDPPGAQDQAPARGRRPRPVRVSRGRGGARPSTSPPMPSADAMAREDFSVHGGPNLRCRGWRQEGLLRLLENVLAVGEDPDNLVVYAALGRAARDWPSHDRIVEALKTMGRTKPCWSSPASRSGSSVPTPGRRLSSWPTATWSAAGRGRRCSTTWSAVA
jgi:hypothetical protein